MARLGMAFSWLKTGTTSLPRGAGPPPRRRLKHRRSVGVKSQAEFVVGADDQAAGGRLPGHELENLVAEVRAGSGDRAAAENQGAVHVAITDDDPGAKEGQASRAGPRRGRGVHLQPPGLQGAR